MKSDLIAIASGARRRAFQAVGFVLVLSALGTPALATSVGPEIDPGALMSGLALLGCGLAILTHRTHRK